MSPCFRAVQFIYESSRMKARQKPPRERNKVGQASRLPQPQIPLEPGQANTDSADHTQGLKLVLLLVALR